MVNKNCVDSLRAFGVSESSIEKIKANVKFEYDWGFTDGYFKTNKTDEEIYNIIRERKIQAAQYKIIISPQWKEQILLKASQRNQTFEEALRNDAIWVVNLDEQTQKEMTQ